MAHLSPQQFRAAKEAYRDAFRLQQALAEHGFIFTWNGRTREIRGRTAVHHNAHHHEERDRRDLWWDYEPEDLEVLCGPCHALVHHKMKRARGLLYHEVCARTFREIVIRQNEELDDEVLEWEVNRALGWGRDATVLYDPDNAGDWEAEYGEDLGDVLEEIATWRESDDYEEEFGAFAMDLEYEGLGDD